MDADLKLLVAIPALNEERTVGDVIRAVPPVIPGVGSIHVIVVDDGSGDHTAKEAQAAGATVLSHPANFGVGSAFRTAVRYALEQRFDIVVTMDADGQFSPADIPALVMPLISGVADCVTASRFLEADLTPKMPAAKLWGNRTLARVLSRLAGRPFSDVSCGFRAYNREAVLHLNLLGRFTYTQEVLLNLAFKQQRIVEVPLAVRGTRQHGQSRVASNLPNYAIRAAAIILRCYRDYRPMRLYGFIAGVMTVAALVLGGFQLAVFLETGSLSPHKWAGFSAAALALGALLMLFTGLVGDMLNRHRIYLEELLYYVRAQPSNSATEIASQPAGQPEPPLRAAAAAETLHQRQ